MSRFSDEVEREIQERLQVSKEAYEAWRENVVTQRLMAEMELNILEERPGIIGQSVDEVAINAATSAQFVRSSESILEWKPQELLSDD